jgi:hypothetical protein
MHSIQLNFLTAATYLSQVIISVIGCTFGSTTILSPIFILIVSAQATSLLNSKPSFCIPLLESSLICANIFF